MSVALDLERAAGDPVMGIDEAGRGPLVGGVYAAAVSVPLALAEELLKGPWSAINDSKKLSEKKRFALAEVIRTTPGCIWAVASASPQEIDELNILRATHLAMRRAADAVRGRGVLPRQNEDGASFVQTRQDAASANFSILVDGLPVPTLPNSTNVIKGDAKSLFIAAASILAKTARDEDCFRLEREYPGYGFAKHKGYPTPEHLKALAKLGPCPEHRRSFGPVSQTHFDFGLKGLSGIVLLAASLTFSACAAAVGVDAELPAGNVVVEKVDGDTVTLHQDLRDTGGDWFYWKFRVTGAEGRSISFRFTKSAAVGSRGPAVSTDRGRTWTWGDDLQPSKRREAKTNDHGDWNGFAWTFGGEDREVWFSQTIPYDAADWRAFLDRHADERGRLFEEGVLCKSRKGRAVECARFGRLDGKAVHRIFLSSRHHCGEASATYVLEGVLEQVFATDAIGAWLRENVEFRVVPFADRDGVTDGDQGKMRRPHDHARDYNEDRPVLYPEVRAIMKMLREWHPTVVTDFHSPWLRGNWFEKNNSNEYLYQVGLPSAPFWEKQRAFGAAVERVQRADVGYRQADDFAPGQGWNSAANYRQGKTLVRWASGAFTNAALVTTWEIPFANSRFKTLYPSDLRAFGRDVAAGFRAYVGDDDGVQGARACGAR